MNASRRFAGFLRSHRLAAVLVTATLLASACGGDDDPDVTPTLEPSPTPASIAERLRAFEVPADLVDGRRVGEAGAPVEIVVYEDFRCSHCLEFTANVEPMLIEDYVATGKASLEIRHFPILGDASVAAAQAAQCALMQDAFWPYQKALFIEQAENRPISPASLAAVAGDLGLDADALTACLNDGDTFPEVEADFEEARELGFTGTPAVMVNGDPLPANPGGPDEWRTMIDEALAG